MTRRRGCSGHNRHGRCNKRAKHTGEESSEAISVRETAQDSEISDTLQASATMPPAVFPLLWNFLLGPSTTMDPDSQKASIDFQSTASFMLVSRATKEAFDECNGWKQCLNAARQEIRVKDEYIESFIDHIGPLYGFTTLSNEDMDACSSILNHEDRIQAMSTRLVHLRKDVLPEASRLAGLYCAVRVPRPDYFEDMRIVYTTFDKMLNSAFLELKSNIQRELARRVLALANDQFLQE